jgi:hypothetical protein
MLKTARLRKDRRTKKKWKDAKAKKKRILENAREDGRYKGTVKKRK